MVRITIDADLPRRLAQLREPAELFSADGHRLGRFLPEGPLVLSIEQAREIGVSPFDDEEIERLRAEAGEGRPLVGIWKELGRE